MAKHPTSGYRIGPSLGRWFGWTKHRSKLREPFHLSLEGCRQRAIGLMFSAVGEEVGFRLGRLEATYQEIGNARTREIKSPGPLLAVQLCPQSSWNLVREDASSFFEIAGLGWVNICSSQGSWFLSIFFKKVFVNISLLMDTFLVMNEVIYINTISVF